MYKLAAVLLFAAFASAKDGKDFNTPEYLASSRQEKSDKIWAKVIENTESGKTHYAGALVVDEDVVFETVGDELECGFTGCRNKTIHPKGTVTKVEWISEGSHPYTGIFRGADTCYVRNSSAAQPDTKKPNLTPGMGIKCLRDGMDSANFVSMFSVDGQDDLNFFANNFENHIPDVKSFTLKPLEARFATATDWIQTVGLSNWAGWDQEGNAESASVFPWKLTLVPHSDLKFASTVEEGYTDYLNDLMSIQNGQILWYVSAWDKPEELGGTMTPIGKIVTSSETTTSYWGDEHMYFRH